MNKLQNIFKQNPSYFLVILILLIGIFFRNYKLIETFEFAHDGDLYSWIAKDITVNHHLRLSGQETSAPGIFIGPLYYYLNIPFFLLTGMDPVGALIPITIIGILVVLSYYWVFAKMFNTTVGLIASFLYSTSLYTIAFDKRVVPSTPTNLWIIWYFYTIVNLTKGNFSVLPLLAILLGLIWHIHIALFPTLIAIPIALIFAKKIPQKRQIITFLIILFISSLPLITFEARHNFSQTKSFINNFTSNFGASNYVSETRSIYLGNKNENGALNLNPSSKYILEIDPEIAIPGEKINLKVTTKNPKYSTTIVYLDCGDPQKFEIGYITAEYKWSTVGCSPGEHKLTATGRVAVDPVLKKFITKGFIVAEKENRNINSMFLAPINLPEWLQYTFTLVILITPLIAGLIKSISKKQVVVLYSWILGVFVFFTFSSIAVSEYYLASIDVILILGVSLIMSRMFFVKGYGKYLVLFILAIVLFKSIHMFIFQTYYEKGYLERKNTIAYIKKDMQDKGYPCVSISYITAIGENVGFRYFLWLYNVKTVRPTTGAPIYNIVLPDELSEGLIDKKFGHIGVIVPKNEVDLSTPEKIQKACEQENTNLTEPMFGFTS